MRSSTKRQRAVAYADRFGRVLEFIDKHLAEALPVRQLSRIAHFSEFHFQRQFSLYVGFTPTRYIQLARLRRASYRLAFNPLQPITAIALESGFEHAESFSRAFRQAFGQTPSAFRRAPDWMAWSAPFKLLPIREFRNMQVRIITVPSINVATLEHLGDPALLNDSVRRFITWRKHSGLSPIASSHTFGIAYDDPNAVAPADFRFDICGSVPAPVPANKHGILNKEIPGGRCAVVRHVGSPDNIAGSVHYLYRAWLPNSGEELRGFPVYFHYLNLKSDTPEHELLTDIHLPLK
jgi:AraC family transcriptional regulator